MLDVAGNILGNVAGNQIGEAVDISNVVEQKLRLVKMIDVDF